MENFRRDSGNRFDRGRGGDFKRRDGGRSNFRSDNRDRVMHQAICDQCGKSCELPFRPTGDKPVYCSVCFEGKKEDGSNKRGDRFSQNKFGGQKTDFMSSSSRGNNDELKKQLVILNGKMDQLIKAVEAIANTKSINEKVVKKIPMVKIKKSEKETSKNKKK